LLGVSIVWILGNAYLQQLIRAQRLQSELSLQQQTPPELYWLPLGALLLALFFSVWAYRLHRRYAHIAQRCRQQEQSHQLVTASNNTLRERLRKLTASQRDLQTLLDTVQVGVIIMDAAHWQIRASNQRAGELFGWEANDLMGLSAEKVFVDEKDQQLCRHLIGQHIPITDCELRLSHANKSIFWAMLSMRGLFFNGQPAVAMSVVDISDRIAHAEQLRGEKQETERVLQQLQSVQHELLQLATHDDLTGVANRRHFTNSAETALAHAQEAGRPLSVIMLDIDYFKQVNDTRGHDAGDAILSQTLTVCQNLIHQSDLLGRLGGEEFALLLPDSDDATALEIAERVRSQVAAHPFHVGASFVHITVSLGTASWLPGEASMTFSSLLKAADLALYQAKFEGRNRAFSSRALPSALNYPNTGLFTAQGH
jgi:diguanylate cyclase (GGDEF)-like protein/PAS domain S-box-containing protein